MNRDKLPQLRPLTEGLPAGVEFEDGSDYQTLYPQFKEYLKVIIKYRMLILTSIVLLTLIALIYAFTVTPRYTAESVIKISTYQPILTATKIEDMLQQRSKEANYLETQVKQIKSYSLADRVLSHDNLKEQIFGKDSPGLLATLFGWDSKKGTEAHSKDNIYNNSVREIQSYLDRIEVKPLRRTSLVKIQATFTDPVLAARVANTHAREYINWVREARVSQQSAGLKFLKGQAQELRQKVADLEREQADYAEANSIVAVNKDENITAQKMSQLNRLLTAATAKRLEAEHLYQESLKALKNNAAGIDDASTQEIRSRLAKLEAEYQQLSAKFTPNYPKMQQLRYEIKALKQSIEGQRAQIVAGLKAKALAAAEEERSLKEELEKQKSMAFELSKRQVQYNILNRELQSARELLQNVLRQIDETSVAVEGNSSNVSIVDHAAVPLRPSFPKKGLVILIGLVLGTGLGFSLAFFLNYLDDTIRTPEELTAYTALPSLGVVPSFEIENLLPENQSSVNGAGDIKAATGQTAKSNKGRGEKTGAPVPSKKPDNFPVVYLRDPKSLASEAYRTIRTGILLSQAGEPPRTILLSSAQSSEGKTTTTLNLAASLASAGGRVVLIDADLRRPSLLKIIDGEERIRPGVVEVITGQANLEDVLIRDAMRRVSLLPSGNPPPNPAELLGSIEMAGIIDKLATMFDYVLIDSPPILPVTDSVILSRYVDGVVLVVRGASTPRKVVLDAKERLRSVGARFLGAILNDVDVTSGDYYYYNRYYYSYYNQEKHDSRAAS